MTPFVSGNSNSTTKNCSAIISAKKTNGAPPERAASMGKIHEMSAAITQCVKLPRLCPLARTRFGKTSLRYTQITAPCENAKEAMKPTSNQTSRFRCAWLKKIAETPARHTAVPTDPASSSRLRPIRSMTDIAIMVNKRLVPPTATACKSPDTLLNPALLKMSFR